MASGEVNHFWFDYASKLIEYNNFTGTSLSHLLMGDVKCV